ncbi:hypothetical protein ACF3VQ_03405 [Yersinia sp. HM-2024]|uniref:hypothetical protein n=1 Tax=Yersinia sp. HM-2024 TaxID=3344550 RepID=UPI00370DD8E6
MKWYRRFDEASNLLDNGEIENSYEPVRITRWINEIAPHSGRWASIINGTTQYIQLREGPTLPVFEDIYGKKHQAC